MDVTVFWKDALIFWDNQHLLEMSKAGGWLGEWSTENVPF